MDTNPSPNSYKQKKLRRANTSKARDVKLLTILYPNRSKWRTSVHDAGKLAWTWARQKKLTP